MVGAALREGLKAMRPNIDALRVATFGADAKLLLLKSDGGTIAYSTLETLTDGWMGSLAGGTLNSVRVDRGDAAFSAKVMEASHVLITDTTNATLNNRLLQIDRNTTMPVGLGRQWKIGVGAPGKRFTP